MEILNETRFSPIRAMRQHHLFLPFYVDETLMMSCLNEINALSKSSLIQIQNSITS